VLSKQQRKTKKIRNFQIKKFKEELFHMVSSVDICIKAGLHLGARTKFSSITEPINLLKYIFKRFDCLGPSAILEVDFNSLAHKFYCVFCTRPSGGRPLARLTKQHQTNDSDRHRLNELLNR